MKKDMDRNKGGMRRIPDGGEYGRNLGRDFRNSTFASMGRFQFLGSSLTIGGVPSLPLWQETKPGKRKIIQKGWLAMSKLLQGERESDY